MVSISPEGGEDHLVFCKSTPSQPSRPQWCHVDSGLVGFVSLVSLMV